MRNCIKNSLDKKRTDFLLVLSIVFFLLLRAWPRLLHPDVWAEDGVVNLYGFLTTGIKTLMQPVNGYLIFIPKIITVISAKISITFYPLISTILAWFFTLFVLMTIAKAPLQIKGRFLLAFFCLMIPTDPEVFGLPLYTFWWSSLLLFIMVFWDEKSDDFWFRTPLIALSSLSSPVCLTTLPLFWLRALTFRQKRSEIKIAVIATLFAGIQFFAMFYAKINSELSLITLKRVPLVFFGPYAIRNINEEINSILSFFIFTYILVSLARNRASRVLWGMCYLLCASILMSLSRTDINGIHPVFNGPRYFFFPFITLSWTLLQIVVVDHNRYFRAIGIGLLSLSVLNAIPKLGRNHDNLNWREHLSSCQNFTNYTLPVHFYGDKRFTWGMNLPGPLCEEVIKKDFFSKFLTNKQFPYRYFKFGESSNRLITPVLQNIKLNQWKEGSDDSFYSKNLGLPEEFQIVGFYSGKVNHLSELIMRIHRGDQVLYRAESNSDLQRIEIVNYEDMFLESAPTAQGWVVLDFSNKLLPDEFDVRFTARKNARGDHWSAIAIRREH